MSLEIYQNFYSNFGFLGKWKKKKKAETNRYKGCGGGVMDKIECVS